MLTLLMYKCSVILREFEEWLTGPERFQAGQCFTGETGVTWQLPWHFRRPGNTGASFPCLVTPGPAGLRMHGSPAPVSSCPGPAQGTGRSGCPSQAPGAQARGPSVARQLQSCHPGAGFAWALAQGPGAVRDPICEEALVLLLPSPWPGSCGAGTWLLTPVPASSITLFLQETFQGRSQPGAS